MDRAALVTDNLRLVHKMANRYIPRVKDNAIDYDDLYSEGCVGLIKAPQTFDPSKGYRFATYACSTISGFILRSIRKKGFSVPHHIIDVAVLIARHDIQELPVAEIAARLGCSVNWATWALKYLELRAVSMDHSFTAADEETENYSNLIPHEEDYSTAIVQDFFNTLKPRHLEVLKMVMTGKDYRQIGEQIGITYQGVGNRMKSVKKFMTQYQAVANGQA